MSDNVKLHIVIDIDVDDDDVDTGYTVEAWNALTDAQRDRIIQEEWETLAQRDTGGTKVITPGAIGSDSE